MPEDVKTYSISELAREFDVTPRALRFYEDKGLIAPRRDGLSRIYGRRERARLKIILRLKRVGFPLSDVKELLDLYDRTGDNEAQNRVALDKYRRRLKELRAQQEDVSVALRETEKAIAWLSEHAPESATLG